MEDLNMVSGGGMILTKDTWTPEHLGNFCPTPQYKNNIEIWNFSSAYISVADRTGLNYLLKPCNLNDVGRSPDPNRPPHSGVIDKPGIYIKCETITPWVSGAEEHQQPVVRDSRNIQGRMDGSKLGKALNEGCKIENLRLNKHQHRASTFVFVPLADILDARGVFYLRDLDLFFSAKLSNDDLRTWVMDNQDGIAHPYSEECRTRVSQHMPDRKIKVENDENPLPAIGIHLVQVDNKNSGKRYFVNVGKGLVTEVPRVKRPQMEDGFWFFVKNTEWKNLDELLADPTAKHFNYEDARSEEIYLKCFESSNEAKVFGDRESEYQDKVQKAKEELIIAQTELEHVRAELTKEREKEKRETEKLKAKFEEEKRQYELEQQRIVDEGKRKTDELKAKYEEEKRQAELRHQEALNKLEMEKAKLKDELDKERERRKDYYEQRSQDRSDSSGTWKFVTGCVTAGIAIAVAVCKWLL